MPTPKSKQSARRRAPLRDRKAIAGPSRATGEARMSVGDIVRAIKKAKGHIATAADILGCGAAILYIRARTESAIKEAIYEARERRVDLAETVLDHHLSKKKRSLKAAQFTLSRLGKDRGWGQVVDVKHSGGVDQNITVDIIARAVVATVNGTKQDKVPDAMVQRLIGTTEDVFIQMETMRLNGSSNGSSNGSNGVNHA